MTKSDAPMVWESLRWMKLPILVLSFFFSLFVVHITVHSSLNLKFQDSMSNLLPLGILRFYDGVRTTLRWSAHVLTHRLSKTLSTLSSIFMIRNVGSVKSMIPLIDYVLITKKLFSSSNIHFSSTSYYP